MLHFSKSNKQTLLSGWEDGLDSKVHINPSAAETGISGSLGTTGQGTYSLKVRDLLSKTKMYAQIMRNDI